LAAGEEGHAQHDTAGRAGVEIRLWRGLRQCRDRWRPARAQPKISTRARSCPLARPRPRLEGPRRSSPRRDQAPFSDCQAGLSLGSGGLGLIRW